MRDSLANPDVRTHHSVPRFKNCPCCQSKRIELFFHNPNNIKLANWRDFFYGSNDFISEINICKDCNYHFINTLPQDYISFYEKQPITESLRMAPYRLRYFKSIKKVINKRMPISAHAKLLDIGCAEGAWLNQWPTHQRFGCEYSEEYLKILSTSGITPIRPEEMHQRKYDLISMFDLLEHIENPATFLEETKPLLSHNGAVVIGVPNMDKLFAKILKSKYYLYCPMHFSYFGKKSLKALLERIFQGYNVQIMPSPQMKSDLRGIFKWLGLNLPDRLNFSFPFGYSASLLCLVYKV